MRFYIRYHRITTFSNCEFQKKQKQTKSFECDLKQILKIEDIKEPIESKGHIYYKAPDKLLIKFDEPANEFAGSDAGHPAGKTPRRYLHQD